MSCLLHPSSMLVACAALWRCRLSTVLLVAYQESSRLVLHTLWQSDFVDAFFVRSGTLGAAAVSRVTDASL